MIPHHIAPKLSEIDLMVARAVPPGGNWKNIPESVPSQRLQQIRESYKRGEGSRSTYYGRLLATEPAYTISTYFTRPGNGCHLHFDPTQNRTLSYREAARLQSFPDSFLFEGSNSSIAKQVGNAVPPILGYWLASRVCAQPGEVVDLFAGAGGLSLGFQWAGWRSIAASDIDEAAMSTFSRNVHESVVVGDIRDAKTATEIVRMAGRRNTKVPRLLVGGPPCQGFSTAGNRRSRGDERNNLFRDYCELVTAIDPDAFLFENVTGILNMEGGAIFEEVLSELREVATEIRVWRVSAEDYGVPQRRKRVLIAGFRRLKPLPLEAGPSCGGLLGGKPVSVQSALGDLPTLVAGEDGSRKQYRTRANTPYQRLMRGQISPQDYISTLGDSSTM